MSDLRVVEVQSLPAFGRTKPCTSLDKHRQRLTTAIILNSFEAGPVKLKSFRDLRFQYT